MTQPDNAQETATILEATPKGHLCPEGQALRGITAHGTPICTHLTVMATQPAPAPKSAAVAAEALGAWCLRHEVLGAAPSHPICTTLWD